MIDWYRTPYDGYAADTPVGRFGLRTSTGVGRLSFQPPRGEHFEEERARYDALSEEEKRTQEGQELASRTSLFGSDDAFYGENVLETMVLAEMMLTGDAHLAPAEEQLLGAGFGKKYPDKLPDLWSRRIKSGTLDVWLTDTDEHRGMRSMFQGDGVNHWHNVNGLIAYQLNHNKTFRLYMSRPSTVTDVLRLGVAHLIRIMEERLARPKGRFSTPLGGSIPRKKYS